MSGVTGPSLQEQLDRGIKAERLLADPLLQEAFKSVSDAIHQTWEDAPLRDTQAAHELKLMLKLLGDVKSVFERSVEDGKLAAIELKELNRRVLSPLSPAQWSGR